MFTLEELESAFAPQINAGHSTLVYVLLEFDYESNPFAPPTSTRTIKHINVAEKSLQDLYNELVADGKWEQVGPWQPTIDTIAMVTNRMSPL